MPPGWSVSAEGKTDLIRAPDGTVFRSRRGALEHMVVSPGKYQGEEVESMRYFLRFEDWTESPDLPAGWRIKRGKKSVLLMGSDGKYFKSLTKAAEFVNRYSRYFNREDVQKIIKLSYTCGKTEKSSKNEKTTRKEKENVEKIYKLSPSSSGKTRQVKKSKIKKLKQRRRKFVPDDSWSSDSTVPEGWLQKKIDLGRNKTFQLLVSPEGQRFKGKRSALQYLIKNKYPAEDIREMRNLLKSDGWENHPDLPINWMYKVRGTKTVFCSPDGTALESKEKALEFIKSNDGSESEIELLKSFMSRNGQTEVRKPKKLSKPDDSWSSDDTIPEGFLQKAVKRGEKKSFQLILSPDGQKFKGKRSLLAHMVKNNYPEEKSSKKLAGT